MTFEEVKELLASCERSELQDHVDKDVEVAWYRRGHVNCCDPVAEAYYGHRSQYLLVLAAPRQWFTGEQMLDLRSLGELCPEVRDDQTGPTCRGACLPAQYLGLTTLAGVKRELGR